MSVQLWGIGAATVIDTVLLIAMLERRNWRRALLPILVLHLGVWLLHAGTFARMLLVDVPGLWAQQVRWFAMLTVAAGWLLLPSAVLHGTMRLVRISRSLTPFTRLLGAATYLPLLVLIPAGGLLANSTGGFVTRVLPLVRPYTMWFGLSTGAAFCVSVLLPRHARVYLGRPGCALVQTGVVFTWLLSWAMVIVTTTGTGDAFDNLPLLTEWMASAVVLLPAIPIVVFAYLVVRYDFLQIVIERSLVYGAIVVGVLLFHHLAATDLASRLGERFRVDLAIVEAVAIIVLVVAYQPIRQRISEALGYLLGSRVHAERDRTRTIAVEMSEMSERSEGDREPTALVDWFVESLASAYRIDEIDALLLDGRGETNHRCSTPGNPDQPRDQSDLVSLHRAMAAAEVFVWSRDEPSAARLREGGTRVGARLAVRFDRGDVAGLVVFGRRERNRPYREEERNALLLLVEQLGSTIIQGMLSTQRLALERRALESEKLSELGLLASSIAHEVKNPLSSIKTIVSLLAEDAGPDHEHAEDLRLVLSEIDRLAATTQELLVFARRPSDDSAPTALRSVVLQALAVLRHLARQHGVEIDVDLAADLPVVRAPEIAVREIVFNLVINAIEAAAERGRGETDDGSSGCVRVNGRVDDGEVRLEVVDDGPGIAPEMRERLFEPFVTTKESGTGLGLFVVARRVAEISGEIACEDAESGGTRIVVRFRSDAP